MARFDDERNEVYLTMREENEDHDRIARLRLTYTGIISRALGLLESIEMDILPVDAEANLESAEKHLQKVINKLKGTKA